MTDYIRREVARMRRVRQFGEDHQLEPANAQATAEYTAINNSIPELEGLEENQDAGKGTVKGAVTQRHILVDSLLSIMSSLSKAAKVLDVGTHPDVATKMRMSGISNLQQLVARANVFHSTLQPIEAEFIALGAAATVAADLQAAITAVEGARDLKLTGRDLHIGGTAGLTVATRSAQKHLRKLNAILCQVYRTNPVLLAQWRAASRMERAPVTATEPADAGSGI